MNDKLALKGSSVLVVDDDFYLAEDAREALEGAGATVLGPYGREDEALGSLKEYPPEYAVLDLNLGNGPSFAIARALKRLGVPMVLVTGYDAINIPADLVGTRCLQKPVSKERLVEAVADLRGQTRRGPPH